MNDDVITSRQRWTIVALLAASITINLLDRQVLAVLASELRSQFQWSNAQYGYIGVAFNLGMMLGQIPAGQLMDRVGTRIGNSWSKSSLSKSPTPSSRHTCGRSWFASCNGSAARKR